MKKTVLLSALAFGALLQVGCGGGEMVGENSPVYGVTPFLNDNINKVVFTGGVIGRDDKERPVILSIDIVDRTTGEATFTVSFNGSVPDDANSVTGRFREVRNRSVEVYMPEFTVTYKDTDNNEYTDKFVFADGPASTLLYSGDPAAGVNLDPPPQKMCWLQWIEEGADAGQQGKVVVRSVQFTTLRTN